MSSLLQNISNIPLSFGGAAISGEGKGYGFGDITENESIDLLLKAKDLGIKIFDTAPIYGFGLSEKRMGLAFEKCREDVFLVSKCGVSWHDNGRVNMSNDPQVTLNMLEQSLRDLKSCYIDLYMVHWPDNRVDIRKTIEVLEKAKNQGKIKHIGLCNTNLDEVTKASEISEIEVIQSEMNFFNTSVRENLLNKLDSQNMSFMSWGTLAKGILTGRVTGDRNYNKSDCRSWAPWWKKSDKNINIEIMKKIFPVLESEGHSGLELALANNLMFKEVDTLLCGARDFSQLEGLFKALNNLPSNDLVNRCREIAKS